MAAQPAGDVAIGLASLNADPDLLTFLKVNAAGNIRVHRHDADWSINVGVIYAGLTLDVIINTIDCIIFHDRQLVRTLRINPDTYHQPSGRKTGGPKQPRLQESQ